MHTTICHDKDGNTYEVPSSDLEITPSVYAVITEDHKILLIPQHGDGYGLPGGRIERGEHLGEALRREVHEETGYHIEPGNLLDMQTSFFRTNTSKRYIHSLLIVYGASIISGEISDTGLEPGERAYMGLAEWVDISELPHLKLYGSIDIGSIIAKYF